MNIKRFDRKGQWGIENAKRYFHRWFLNDDFSGVMALLYFDDVDEPCVWNWFGKPVRVCDKGVKWFQFIPLKENYAVQTVINEENEINLWYINVISGFGCTDDNVVCFTDLNIDIILHPNGNYIIDDACEELEEAFAENDISLELYDLALNTKAKLLNGLLSDTDSLTKFCIKYLNEMENNK